MPGASKLKTFGLSECFELETIDQYVFDGLNNLDNINIVSTSLRVLPENVFSTLNNVKRIFTFYSLMIELMQLAVVWWIIWSICRILINFA